MVAEHQVAQLATLLLHLTARVTHDTHTTPAQVWAPQSECCDKTRANAVAGCGAAPQANESP